MQANPTPDSDRNPIRDISNLWRDLRPTDDRGQRLLDLLLHCDHKLIMHTVAAVRHLTWEMMADELRHHESCSGERAAAIEATARWVIGEMSAIPSCGYVQMFDRWSVDRRERPSMVDLSACPDFESWATERANASREAFDLDVCVREELESIRRVTAAAWALSSYCALLPGLVRGAEHSAIERVAALRVGIVATLRGLTTGSELIRCVHMALALGALANGASMEVTAEQVMKTMELVKGEFGDALRPEARS